MKINHFIPTLVIGASSLLGSCTSKPNAIKTLDNFAADSKLQTILTDTFSTKISDKNKIIEFNKLLKKYNKPVENYIIVDKKTCTATVYSPEGDVLQVSEVALGRHIGDKRGGGYGVKGAELRAFTPPGEFDIIFEGAKKTSRDFKLYGKRVLGLSGDHTRQESKISQILALHRVPATPMGKLRENVFNNNTLKDNRVSFGCVNFLADSYDKMRSFIKGLKTKVYILPEEKGNSLHLETQKDGSYKFFQTKYRYESQEPKTRRVKHNPSKSNVVKDTIPINPLKGDSVKLDTIVRKEVVKSDSTSQKDSLPEIKLNIPNIFD